MILTSTKHSPAWYALLIMASTVMLLVFKTAVAAEPVELFLDLDNLLDTSLERMENRFVGFANYGENGIQTVLLNTFYLLAVIEFSWAFINVYLHKPDLQGFLSVAVSRILFISFFSWLLMRGSTTANEIFASFVRLAEVGLSEDGTPAEVSISPSSVFDAGQTAFARLYWHASDIGVFDIVFDDEVSITTPIMILFIGIFVIITMTILATHFAVVLLETYIAATAGLILLALGSSRWTYQYAATYLKYAVSVGVKLYIFTIIVTLTLGELNNYHAIVDENSVPNLIALLAFCMFTTVVAYVAPKSVKGMVEGVSVGNASSAFARANPARVVSRTTGGVNKLLIPK